LGGRLAASLARRLMLPISRDTLLRVVRRCARPLSQEPIRVLGIDDFAWKRGQRYGTLPCDLQRRQIVDLLADWESNQTIRDLAGKGASIKAITRLTGRSRKLVRSVLRGTDDDVFRCRASVLEPHLAKLGAEWEAGCHNGAELWRRLRAAGFKGSQRAVTE